MTLIITFIFFIFLTPAHADGWSIAVQTDKPCYYYGGRVNVSGVLTYNGYPAQSIDLSIVVRLLGSTGLPYYLKTTTTGDNGGYSDTFPLEGPNAIPGTYIVNVTAAIADVSVTNQTTFQLIQDGSLVRVEAWAKTGNGNQLVEDATVSIPPWNSTSGWVGFNVTLPNQGKTSYMTYGMLATADQDPNPNMVMAAVNATGLSLLTFDGFSEQAWNASKVYARSFLNATYKTNTFEFRDLDNCSGYILLFRELKNETQNRPILISVKETWLEEREQPSPVTTTTTIRSGFASVNQTTAIGIALNITGSSAQDGTDVTVNSTDYDTVQPNWTGDLQVNGVAFYDVRISSSAPLGSNAMASVLIANANFSSQSSAVSYWNGSSWVTVTSQFIPPDSVLVNLLASDLSGTPIMVGIPEFPAMFIPVLFMIAMLLAGLVYKRAKGLPCSAFRTDSARISGH